jgi:LysM repeat protein
MADFSTAEAAALDFTASNGETPTVFVKFTRPGMSEAQSFEVHPTHFEFTTSINGASYVTLTVPDEAYAFIDNAMLTEDLKTEVTVNFGYVGSRLMSGNRTFVFFRQKPSFPQGGHVETTITAYDKSILLSVPIVPRLLKRKEAFSIKEMAEYMVEEARSILKFNLDIKFGPEGEDGTKVPDPWEGKRWRFSQAVGSPMEFLYNLRTIAEGKGENVVPIDLYVKDNVLYFRPRIWPSTFSGYYTYRSPALGARLLSFEPEVNTAATRHAVMGAHPVLDAPINAQHGPQTKAADTKIVGEHYAINAAAELGSREAHLTKVHSAGTGKVGDPVEVKMYKADNTALTHVVKAGETVHSLAAKYGVTTDAIVSANGLSSENTVLTPGQQLTIKVEAYVSDETAAHQSPESRVKAGLSYLLEEQDAVRARAVVLGDPRLEAGQLIAVWNVGVKWNGAWYVEECKQVYDGSGYLTEMSLTRDGFPLGSGLPQKPADTVEKVFKDETAQRPSDTHTANTATINAAADVGDADAHLTLNSNKPAGVSAGAQRVLAKGSQ